jgi:hypothetical protein
MIFAQNTAPVGWTKITASVDDSAPRLTAGNGGATGGQTPFSTAFSNYTPTATVGLNNIPATIGVAGAQLGTSQMGNHAHSYKKPCGSGSSGYGPGQGGIPVGCDDTSGASGSNQAHTHTLSGTLTGSSSWTPTSTNQFQVAYVDFLLCEKN